MKTIILFALLIPSFVMALSGIKFEHELTWQQILKKAAEEKKYIFMDAFTTWCGPCKYMSANVFTQEAVGELFNANFVNVKVQLDTTKKDDEQVKSWYQDAHKIMTEYKVNVFPTFLIFSPEGKLVHRMIGSSEADEFLLRGKNALSEENQYYVMLSKYNAGKKEVDFLYKLAKASQEAFDKENTGKIVSDYFKIQSNYFTKENAELLLNSTESSKDGGFKILSENPKKFDEVLGNNSASLAIIDIIKKEEIFPLVFKKSVVTPDWKTISASVTKKFPAFAYEAVEGAKLDYYQKKQDWVNYGVTLQSYMKSYGSKMTGNQLNEVAWKVFDNCKDVSLLTNALEWSKRSFEGNNNPMFMDTYANLLYKLGQTEEAITWETKAIDMVSESEKKDYSETLIKIKSGEKTWKN